MEKDVLDMMRCWVKKKRLRTSWCLYLSLCVHILKICLHVSRLFLTQEAHYSGWQWKGGGNCCSRLCKSPCNRSVHLHTLCLMSLQGFLVELSEHTSLSPWLGFKQPLFNSFLFCSSAIWTGPNWAVLLVLPLTYVRSFSRPLAGWLIQRPHPCCLWSHPTVGEPGFCTSWCSNGSERIRMKATRPWGPSGMF